MTYELAFKVKVKHVGDGGNENGRKENRGIRDQGDGDTG